MTHLYLFRLANICKVSRRTRAQAMTTSTVQRAFVPKTRGRRQRRRRSSSMKEEKMEVTTSLASGNPFEQSQSRFKSLKWFYIFSFSNLNRSILYLTPQMKSRMLVKMWRQYQKPHWSPPLTIWWQNTVRFVAIGPAGDPPWVKKKVKVRVYKSLQCYL